ncbi:MAG: hypothetical protein WBN71_05195, partial [Acidimicrobiia bacterium]
MGGAAWALFAGVSFGVFQAVNRRVNQLIDPYRTTFALLLVAVVGLGVFSVGTQDLSLLASAPVYAFIAFGAAGVIHFFFGSNPSSAAFARRSPRPTTITRPAPRARAASPAS